MSAHLIVRPDDVIEQILIQCWLFQARAGEHAAARLRAERTLERLLAKGLIYRNCPDGMRLDPYAANNMIKSRRGELDDEAWGAWQETARRNAVSLPAEPRIYRFTIRREWHGYKATPGRPIVLRLPLPLRNAQCAPAQVRLVEPAGIGGDIREMPGRIELRFESAPARGPIVAEAQVLFTAREVRDPLTPAAPIGVQVPSEDEIWLRDREGVVIQSAPVQSLAAELAKPCANAREFVYSAWNWLMSRFRFGDVHRSNLDAADPLGGVLRSRLADCVIGSSLLIALCRARGIPARLLTGYLLHPANLGPHSWAEVRVAPDLWIPVDYGSWCYCAGDVTDPVWATFFRGRVDARFIAEVAPREFTGWGSAPPPANWFRLERLRGDRIEHTLHTLPDGALFRRDVLGLQILEPRNPVLS